MFTSKQITWAASHDWFLGVATSGRIICRDVLAHRDGSEQVHFVSFTTMRELRDFAGY